jgi:hypothetical protein
MRSMRLASVAAAAGCLAVPAGAAADPPGSYCARGWHVKGLRNLGMKFRLAQPVQRNENHTGRSALTTFEVTTQKTFTWHLDVKVSAEAGFAIFASVKTELDAGVQRSVSTNLRNNVTFRIPRHHAAIGKYGFYYRRVTGLAQYGRGDYCVKSVRFYAVLPRGEGWRIYLRRL